MTPSLVRWLVALLGATAVSLIGMPAWARQNGIAAEGCSGCHGGTGDLSLSLSTIPESFEPGSEIEVAVTLIGEGIAGGGVFISTKGVGTLKTISGQGLTQVGTGLVHSQPKGASGGQVEFRFRWQAPGEPGAVRFYVYALGTNGNGQRTGDRPGRDIFERVFGCEGQFFYSDEDGDGYGRDNFAFLSCVGQPPDGFVATPGDCADYDPAINPGAVEICNLKDDNCDGQIDENALPVMLYPDADGDGYYGRVEDGELAGDPVEGCVGLKGYAAEGGDCYPLDPTINPGVEEVCNYYDDDCDGEVDERSRPICGVGWCTRESPTCNAEECRPGEPQPEKCNLLDDDCDGQVDEADDGPLCPTGEDCAEGKCVPIGSLPMPDAGTPEPGGAAGSAGSATASPESPASPSKKNTTDSGCAAGGAARAVPAWLLLSGVLFVAARRWRRKS